MKTKKYYSGFTLIELVVVITILGILAVTLVPLVNSFIEKSRISRLLVDLSTLETAGLSLNGDTGTFPENSNTPIFESDLVEDSTRDGWAGPYLSNKNIGGVSPWGGRYLTDNTLNIANTDEDIADWVIIVDGGGVDGDTTLVPIPQTSVKQIDERMDDGDGLETDNGRIQGTGDQLFSVLIPDAFTTIKAD